MDQPDIDTNGTEVRRAADSTNKAPQQLVLCFVIHLTRRRHRYSQRAGPTLAEGIVIVKIICALCDIITLSEQLIGIVVVKIHECY